MTFELRVLTVGLAAFTLGGCIMSLLVPRLAFRQAGLPAALRARRLAALRLLPAAMSVITGITVTIAFLAFEPRRPQEYLGWTVRVAAVLALAMLIASAWRWARMVAATRRLTRDWFATAEPVAISGTTMPTVAVSSAFPVVAVVGFRRPTLVIARSVLAACTPDELAAVLAHEEGHVARHDNLRRLMMAAAPDILAWLPASERLFADWGNAAEEAADDDAMRAGTDGRWHLASALVKVARLASGGTTNPIPASALYCGQNLDRRVRRLLEPAKQGPPDRLNLVRASAVIATAAVASALVLPSLHALIEMAIRTLP